MLARIRPVASAINAIVMYNDLAVGAESVEIRSVYFTFRMFGDGIMKTVKSTRSRLLATTVLPLAVAAAIGTATPGFAACSACNPCAAACSACTPCGACGACNPCNPCSAD
jgi:hypothetical protein